MTRIRIEWYGHSYFRIIYRGYSIAIDPHDGGSLNLPESRIKADAVLVTHNHYDHNAVEMVEANDIIKWKKGSFKIGAFNIIGLPSYHDKSRGGLRGENVIYVLEADGLRIAHLGDLGHIPDREILDVLDNTHILMIPVGGVYTIDAHEAWELVSILKPPLVIPMHYWIPYSTLPLDPLDRFLSVSKARRLRVEKRALEISREELPEKTTVVIMPPPSQEHVE